MSTTFTVTATFDGETRTKSGMTYADHLSYIGGLEHSLMAYRDESEMTISMVQGTNVIWTQKFVWNDLLERIYPEGEEAPLPEFERHVFTKADRETELFTLRHIKNVMDENIRQIEQCKHMIDWYENRIKIAMESGDLVVQNQKFPREETQCEKDCKYFDEKAKGCGIECEEGIEQEKRINEFLKNEERAEIPRGFDKMDSIPQMLEKIKEVVDEVL